MKRICVESHFWLKEYTDYLFTRKEAPRREFADNGQTIVEWLTPEFAMKQPNSNQGPMSELGDIRNMELRLKQMDEAGIDMQVLSFAHPSLQDLEPEAAVYWCQKMNDELAQAIKRYPGRFSGFARVPFQDPVAAVDEVKRAVEELGLKGIKTDSNVRGEYLDDRKYWPVFAEAERLDVPFYLHPREPSRDMLKPYLAYQGLPGSMWGFGAETSLHAVRLICSGLFDEHPGLKVILGHMGEALPFCKHRLDQTGPTRPSALKRRLSDYLDANFYVSTSGNFYNPALICALLAMGADKILFAVDYVGPMVNVNPNLEAVQFMEAAPISPADREKIYHLNAEKLLKL
jgi:2,3-dihydroxybenzoate decarboxylase